MTIRTILVDDESLARQRVRRMLSAMAEVELVGEAENGVEAVKMIDELRPDLVLLDVQMPGLDGFEVLESLEDLPLVVFITAYDEYAIRAFDVNALDYLLKPFSAERLRHAIERASEQLTLSPMESSESQVGRFADRLTPLMRDLAAAGRYLTRMAVKDGERIRVLDVEMIEWIDIQQERVVAHTEGGDYTVRRTITDLESRLDPATFFRAHRSAIVNLNRVMEIMPWFQGSHRLKLYSGAEVDLSRSRARDLRRKLGW